MVFPKNNLPTDSQPWTRDVEKRVENLESSFRSAEVNNVTRDSQAISQIRRLDIAVTEAAAAAQSAQDAIDAVISLGSSGSTYDINADNITGGTINGVNFNTTGGNESLTLSAGKINFFENGSPIGSMTADTDGSNDYIQITSGTGIGQLTVGSDYTVLAGSGCAVQPGVASSGRIDLTGTLVYCNANLEVSGYMTATGALTGASLALGGGNITGVGSISNVETGGSVRRTALIGGGTTGASITDGGNFVRTSSSQRYKQDIQLLDINLNDLYAIEPKTFRRIEEVEERGEEARTYPGFIAEELAGTSLDKFVFYSQDEEGKPRPEGIHYPELTAALLLAIKDLNARIQVLEGGV